MSEAVQRSVARRTTPRGGVRAQPYSSPGVGANVLLCMEREHAVSEETAASATAIIGERSEVCIVFSVSGLDGAADQRLLASSPLPRRVAGRMIESARKCRVLADAQVGG